MRIIIAVECRGNRPEIELSEVLNEITEKSSKLGLLILS